MSRYTWPVMVPSKKNGPISPLNDSPHQTLGPSKLTSFSTWMCGFSGAQYTQLCQFTVPFNLNCASSDQTVFPTNSSSSRTTFWNHSQYCTLRSWSSSFSACNNLGMKTSHLAVLRMRHMLVLLTPVSRAHCLVDFCDERVNCSNTLAEEAGLVALRGLLDLPLFTSHTVPCVSNLSQMCAIVRHVGGSVAYSRLHYHCTSTTFSNFKYHFKMVLRSSNDNPASTIFLDCPACRMLTLTFIWLTPSFEQRSYYTLLP